MAKIEIGVLYPFEPELVWDALTDRESLNQWLMGPRLSFAALFPKHKGTTHHAIAFNQRRKDALPQRE